jgi:hypothetical protein
MRKLPSQSHRVCLFSHIPQGEVMCTETPRYPLPPINRHRSIAPEGRLTRSTCPPEFQAPRAARAARALLRLKDGDGRKRTPTRAHPVVPRRLPTGTPPTTHPLSAVPPAPSPVTACRLARREKGARKAATSPQSIERAGANLLERERMQLRIGEAGDVARILEVEGHGGSAPRRGHLPGKGGLAHLACADLLRRRPKLRSVHPSLGCAAPYRIRLLDQHVRRCDAFHSWAIALTWRDSLPLRRSAWPTRAWSVAVRRSRCGRAPRGAGDAVREASVHRGRIRRCCRTT